MAQPIAVGKSIRRAVESDAGLGNITTQEMYREILGRLGEDPDRDGLLQTPSRVEKSRAIRKTLERFCGARCSRSTTTRW